MGLTAEPSPGARFVRIADVTDDDVVATVADDGTVIWQRLDTETRRRFGPGVCEARHEPALNVLVSFPRELVARIIDNDEVDVDDVAAVWANLRRTWEGE